MCTPVDEERIEKIERTLSQIQRHLTRVDHQSGAAEEKRIMPGDDVVVHQDVGTNMGVAILVKQDDNGAIQVLWRSNTDNLTYFNRIHDVRRAD